MTNIQTVMMIGIVIFGIIGLWGSMHYDDYNKRIKYNVIMLNIMALLWIVSFVNIKENNRYQEISKGKCPEYELIENVYKLKE